MKYLKINASLVVGAMLSVALLSVTPVSAERGGNTDDAKVAATTESKETTTGEVEELRERGKKQLADERKAQKLETTIQKRQQACEARAKNLTTKIKNFGGHATQRLAKLDATYAKLQAYQLENKLTVDDYEALVAAAGDKRTAAADAVDALNELTGKIDCTTEDPAASVATFKAAVKNARTALQEYHKSVKNVLVGLMTAKSDSKAVSTDTTETN